MIDHRELRHRIGSSKAGRVFGRAGDRLVIRKVTEETVLELSPRICRTTPAQQGNSYLCRRPSCSGQRGPHLASAVAFRVSRPWKLPPWLQLFHQGHAEDCSVSPRSLSALCGGFLEATWYLAKNT